MSAGFCPQFREDSCVAACCAMLLHHRGPLQGESLQETHDRLHASFSSLGKPGLIDARQLGATHGWMDATDEASFGLLETYVARTWCAVVVHGGIWSHALRHRKLTRPHGHLSRNPASPGPPHAVVLTACDPVSISVYDPWFDMLSQPVRAEPAWLRRAWTGEFAYLPEKP